MLTVHDLIKHAIRKWERISEITEEEFPILCDEFNPLSTCVLCLKFINCKKCPVHEKTGSKGCINTPYELTEVALNQNYYDYWKIHSKKEVEFLKKILKNTENFDVPDAQEYIDTANESLKELEKALKHAQQ